MTVYGTGLQTRCFCHVSDVIRGLTELMDAEGAEGRVFNLGSQAEISILDLAATIKELTSSSSEILVIPYDEALTA